MIDQSVRLPKKNWLELVPVDSALVLRPATYSEDSLHLGQIGPRVRTRQHLDNETTQRPNVGFARVRSLFDHFRCHPIY